MQRKDAAPARKLEAKTRKVSRADIEIKVWFVVRDVGGSRLYSKGWRFFAAPSLFI